LEYISQAEEGLGCCSKWNILSTQEMLDSFTFHVGRTLLIRKISVYHINNSFRKILVRVSVDIAPFKL
jgi:hypothetical protein